MPFFFQFTKVNRIFELRKKTKEYFDNKILICNSEV